MTVSNQTYLMEAYNRLPRVVLTNNSRGAQRQYLPEGEYRHVGEVDNVHLLVSDTQVATPGHRMHTHMRPIREVDSVMLDQRQAFREAFPGVQFATATDLWFWRVAAPQVTLTPVADAAERWRTAFERLPLYHNGSYESHVYPGMYRAVEIKNGDRVQQIVLLSEGRISDAVSERVDDPWSSAWGAFSDQANAVKAALGVDSLSGIPLYSYRFGPTMPEGFVKVREGLAQWEQELIAATVPEDDRRFSGLNLPKAGIHAQTDENGPDVGDVFYLVPCEHGDYTHVAVSTSNDNGMWLTNEDHWARPAVQAAGIDPSSAYGWWLNPGSYTIIDEEPDATPRPAAAPASVTEARSERHAHDLVALSLALSEVATERGLCSEYDDEVHQIAESLGVPLLNRRTLGQAVSAEHQREVSAVVAALRERASSRGYENQLTEALERVHPRLFARIDEPRVVLAISAPASLSAEQVQALVDAEAARLAR